MAHLQSPATNRIDRRIDLVVGDYVDEVVAVERFGQRSKTHIAQCRPRVVPGIGLHICRTTALDKIVGAGGIHRRNIPFVRNHGCKSADIEDAIQTVVGIGIEFHLQAGIQAAHRGRDIVVRIVEAVSDGSGFVVEGASGYGPIIGFAHIDHRCDIGGTDIDVGAHPEVAAHRRSHRRSSHLSVHGDTLDETRRLKSCRDRSSGIDNDTLARGIVGCGRTGHFARRTVGNDEHIGSRIAAQHIQLDQQAILVAIVAPLGKTRGAIVVDSAFPDAVVVGGLGLADSAFEDGPGLARIQRSNAQREVPDPAPLAGQEATRCLGSARRIAADPRTVLIVTSRHRDKILEG